MTLQISGFFFLDIYPGVELLGHDGSVLEDPPYCSSQGPHLFTRPSTGSKGSLFSPSSATVFVCRLFDGGHSDRCEMTFHCRFDFHPLIISGADSSSCAC